MTIYKKNVHKLISMVLCFALIAGCTMSSFAAIGGTEAGITASEQCELNGEQYTLERQIYNDKVVATVYNESNVVVSSFTNELASGTLNGYFAENVKEVQPYATDTTGYKLVSTMKGTLKPAAWTTVAVIAAIAALNPGAGAAAVAAVASAIVTDAGSSYTYKMETWTKSDRTYFYQKTIFKIYNKSGKKVGPDLVTSTKTRQK